MSRNYKRLIVVLLVLSFFMQFSAQRVYGDSKNLSAVGYSISQIQLNQLNERLPELLGGPEIRVRTRRHNPALHNVFYTGPRIKEVALTFDDGPDERFTPQILDILRKNDIKATFFIMGKRAETYPGMVKRIIGEGHTIGNHTWNHPNISKLSPEKVRDEIDRTNALLYRLTGYKPALFRPPYGAATIKVVREVDLMGFNVIDWSVDTLDWAGTPTPNIIKIVKKEMHPGAIVLEHCAGGVGENLENTVRALPEIIDFLKGEGYKFVTIPKLLSLPASMK